MTNDHSPTTPEADTPTTSLTDDSTRGISNDSARLLEEIMSKPVTPRRKVDPVPNRPGWWYCTSGKHCWSDPFDAAYCCDPKFRLRIKRLPTRSGIVYIKSWWEPTGAPDSTDH